MRAVFVLLWLLAGSALAQESASSVGAEPGRELGLRLGYAFGQDEESGDHGGPGLRLHLLKRWGPYFAVGPELGLYARAGSRLIVSWDGSTHGYRIKNRPLLHLGGMARLGLELGRVRPSFVMGLGWYQAANSIVGLSMGAEVEVRFTDWLPLVIDARLHEDLFSLDLKMERYSHQHYRSLGLGTRLTW
jgi:hypothetical protein